MATPRNPRRAAAIAALVLTLSLGLLAACGTTPPAPTPDPEPTGVRIAFVSERSVVLTQVGQTAQLHAVVLDEDDREIDGASVTWHSSDPQAVSVTADGVVRAEVDLGSAVVVASYGDLQPEGATVLVAELAPSTRLIASDDVLSHEELGGETYDVQLRHNDQTAGIAAGDVLMSGERAGMLVRVLSAIVEGDTVRVVAEEAALTDAFLRLQANLRGPTVSVQFEVVDETADALVLRPAAGSVAALAMPTLTCKSPQVQLDIPLRLSKLRFDLDFQPIVILETESSTSGKGSETSHFEASVALTGDVEVAFADVRIGVRGKVTCEAQVTRIPFGSFVGPLFVGLNLPIFVGTEMELEFEAAEVAWVLPQKRLLFDRTMGVRWTAEDGVEAVWEKGPDESEVVEGSGAGAGSWDLALRVKGKVEGFLEFRPGLFGGLYLPPWGYDFELMRIRTTAGLRAEVEPPLLTSGHRFVGPELELYLGAKGDFKPATSDLVDRLGKLLGRPNLKNVLNVEIILFDVRAALGVQPRPFIDASTDRVDADQPSVTFTAVDPTTVNPLIALLRMYGSGPGEAEFHAFRDGDPDQGRLLGTAAMSTDNTASYTWTPGADDEGVYQVFAAVKVGPLWFGSQEPTWVTVGDKGIRLDPPFFDFPKATAPFSGAGGFDIVNEGAEVPYRVWVEDEHLTLTSPSSGVLAVNERVHVTYLWRCPQPTVDSKEVYVAIDPDGGGSGPFREPLSHTLTIECEEDPEPDPDPEDPLCEDGDCDWPGFPGGGDGTGDGDVVDVGGATGRSWGDPHLVTLDGRPYDFHGVGDYVLSRATDPNDDFQVQVRYRALRPGEPWYSPSGISVGVGVAASVRGHAVTVLIDAAGRYEAYLDGAQLDAADDLALELPNRGTLRIEGSQATITWPDSTSVTLDGRTGRARGFDYLDDIRLYVPSRRLGKVEGLLGDADRDPLNDLRVPGGEPVLQISPGWLYGEFRDAWRVPVDDPASLFATGPELFDPDFPAVVVTLSDFTDAERTAARAACEAAGVVSPLFLQSCMLDVLITGDADVAEAAFLADPGTPKLSLTPALAFVYGGSERYFGAVVEGSSDRRVTWSASRGTLTPWNATGTFVRFTPPEDLDEDVVLTASLVTDGRVTATARVVLLETPCLPPEGFDKVWQGGVDASWSNPDNWLPAGVPTNADRAYVCAASANQPALTANAQVGALATEPGARVRLGSVTLSVHGDLHLAASTVAVESGSLRVVGDGAILTGTLPTITINALTAAGGQLTVDGSLTLGLDRPAHVDPNGHTLTVLGNLATTSVGCLTSTRPEDQVVIQGATTLNGWSNQTHCALTAGTLELRGNLTTTAGQSFDRLTPNPGHTTRLAGTSPQAVTIGALALGHPSGNRFHDLEIANPAGVTFSEPVEIRGDVRFAANAGPVSGATTVHLDGDIDEPQGGARWQVATTNLRGPERTVTIPATIVNDLVVNSQIVLGHPLTVEGNLTIATTGAARLDPGPHALTVLGDLATVSGQNVNGCLAMTAPGAQVIIHGRTILNGWTSTQGCEMTVGVLELRGDLTTTAGQQFSRLTPGPGLATRLTGTTHQTITIGGLAVGHPQGNRFHDLEIANPAGVTFTDPVEISGDVRFSPAAGTLTSTTTVFLDGSVHEPLGGARWQVPTTDLRGTDRELVLPATLHGDLIVNGEKALQHPLTVTGDVTIATVTLARFDPASFPLTIHGNLTTGNASNVNGCLTMTSGTAHVIVHGNARFNGYMNAQNCAMHAGVLELHGDLSTADVWNDMFTPAGSHLVRFVGAGVQEVAFGGVEDHPSTNRFHNVEIVNAAGVTFTRDTRVHGQLEVVGRLKNEAILFVPLGGHVWLRSGATFDNTFGALSLGGTCLGEKGVEILGAVPEACWPEEEAPPGGG